MKKILVPFQFDEVSRNALAYAFEAFKGEAKFVILHVLDGNLDLNDPLTYTAGLTRGDGLILEVDRIVAQVHQEIGFEVDYVSQLEIGSVVEMLVSCAEKDGFDAVVMGTRDRYDFFDRLLGTVSLGVVKRVSLPIYLIPKGCKYSFYKQVVIAADYHLKSDDTLEMLAFWNKDFKAAFHFLHILDGNAENEGFAENIIEEYFEERDLDFPFSIVQKKPGVVADEIIEYAEAKNADLQIIVTDKMSWLATLASKGVSKKMILKATKPMLFVHSGYRKRSSIFFSEKID